jgi:hypothetical protein
VAILPWGLSFGAGGLFLASDLGVLARFDGPYRTLAFVALAACLGIALFGAALGFLLQPHEGRERGWLLERSATLRRITAGGLFGLAALLVYVDRTVETSGYPAAHDALRWATLASLIAGVWSFGFARLPRPERLNLLLLAAFATTFTLTRAHATELAALTSRPFSSLALRTLEASVDFDQDGHAALFGGGDCAPFDPSVHPGRSEVPGNGIDDNCRRGDAPSRRESEKDVLLPEGPAPRSVVLITIDTLAARRMSLYGAKRKTTPELERWAEDAVVFQRAYSSGGWTSLAIPSLFRGLYPRRLRWTRLADLMCAGCREPLKPITFLGRRVACSGPEPYNASPNPAAA